MTLCSDVVGYLYFGGPCCFLLYDKVNGAGKGALDIGRDDKTDWKVPAWAIKEDKNRKECFSSSEKTFFIHSGCE